ncbi:pilus assembly protein, partial [Salmonella enterica]
MSEHNDAVLLYHNPETTAHELLVDSQQRTDVAVQQRVMSLMEENPGVTMRLVTRSELLRCSEMARQLSEQGEKGLRLEDIKKEVSSRQGDILNYFMVAKEIGASD